MPVPSSPVSMQDLMTEFNAGSTNIKNLGSFYAGGGRVPTGWNRPLGNEKIASSGTIRLGGFSTTFQNHAPLQPMVIGVGNLSGVLYGYSALSNPSYGSITNPGLVSGVVVVQFVYNALTNPSSIQMDIFGNNVANSNATFNRIYLNGITLNRTAASYSTGNGATSFVWGNMVNYFGTSGTVYPVIR